MIYTYTLKSILRTVRRVYAPQRTYEVAPRDFHLIFMTRCHLYSSWSRTVASDCAESFPNIGWGTWRNMEKCEKIINVPTHWVSSPKHTAASGHVSGNRRTCENAGTRREPLEEPRRHDAEEGESRTRIPLFLPGGFVGTMLSVWKLLTCAHLVRCGKYWHPSASSVVVNGAP